MASMTKEFVKLKTEPFQWQVTRMLHQLSDATACPHLLDMGMLTFHRSVAQDILLRCWWHHCYTHMLFDDDMTETTGSIVGTTCTARSCWLRAT